MGTAYVIDGYNLLHAMGVLSGRVGPGGLEKARGRLLGLLQGALGEGAAGVTVVFDAANAPPGLPSPEHQRGIRVVFAPGKQEADDVIEGLIRQSSSAKQLQVISNDHRLQQAARRRGCQVRGCDEFLTWLDRHRGKRQDTPPKPEKKDRLSDSEIKSWLEEFGDLEHDPALKKAFEVDEFEKEVD